MEKSKIVFLDRATLPDTIEFTGPDIPHDLVCHEQTADSETGDRIMDADIVITNKVKLDAAAINQAQRLKMIAVAATGSDNIDLQACKARGIVVSNIRNYADDSVPEHTFALILALQRKLLAYHNSIKQGRWQESGQFCYFDYPIQDLAGSTIGIIGSGVLGQSVARLARAFNMNVQFVTRESYSKIIDPIKKITEFHQVLKTSDIISLHCPLTDDTRGLIGPKEFAMMDKKPIIINTARGGLVDEMALEQALINGQINGAGFDVASQEPIGDNHPFTRILDLPNFILTPHIAWSSKSAINRLVAQLNFNIESFYNKRPTNVVTA